MKHWQRFLGTIIAVVTAVIWINIYEPETGPNEKQRADYFSQVLDTVSKNWSVSDLKSLMNSRIYASEQGTYATQFQKLKSLGRFLGCERLQLGDFADDALDQPPFNKLDVDAAYQGNGRCAFANGEADVLVGYVKPKDQLELALLKIDNVSLASRERSGSLAQ